MLEHLELRRGDVLALAQVEACVRRIEVSDAGYRIGCELRRPRRAPQAHPRIIRDRALCSGLLHSAVTSGTLFLTEPATGQLLLPADGTVDTEQEHMTLDVGDHTFRLFDVLEGSFELSGCAYRCRMAVCGVAPLALKLPPTIDETRQRATLRWRPLGTAVTVLLESPLLAGTIERAVYDLSATGLSFEAFDFDLVPIGMQFDRVELRLGEQTLDVAGRIRSVARGPQGRRCGISFDDLDADKAALLADFIVARTHPGLESGRNLSFDELCQFFRDAAFLTPDKEALLAPMIDQVKAAFVAINARPNAILRTVVIRQEGKLIGHCAGIRAYRSTWMFHHLAALGGRASGTLVSMGAAEYLMQSAEYDYFRMWFFAEAAFPKRMFGGFARKVADDDQSCIRYFSHFHVPVDRRFGGAETGIVASEATDDELAIVERYFIASELPLVVHAEDLTVTGLRMAEVDRAFRAEGVERRRVVIAARKQGVVVGFALAELSSVGLNLSEALSSFRMFVLPEQQPRRDIHRALLDAVLPVYAAAGRAFARCLIDRGDGKEFEALGIELDRGTSVCWTSARSQLQPFAEHMRRSFSGGAPRASLPYPC
jgi:hypothetical protein